MSKNCTFYKDTYSWWYVTHDTAVSTSIHIANCKDCQKEYVEQNKKDKEYFKIRSIIVGILMGATIIFTVRNILTINKK